MYRNANGKQVDNSLSVSETKAAPFLEAHVKTELPWDAEGRTSNPHPGTMAAAAQLEQKVAVHKAHAPPVLLQHTQ